MKQNDQEIIVDHFPNSKIYKINKNNGLVVEEKTSTKTIELSKQQNSFNINKFNIKINKNIIAQPQINCFDQNNKLQWSYQTEHKVNHNEFYQFGQRLLYLNADNNLLTSILIDENEPQTQKIKKINFFILENFQEHDFYKNKSNHQLTFVETKISKFKIILNNWFNKITYLFKNFSQIKKVDINLELLPNQTEFTIFHQQNFYRNVFTDVKIEAEFSRNNQSETIKVKGFYYDHNLWKVRAKLSQGQWNWQIKVRTPFWTNKQSGNIEIKNDQTKNLTIENGGLINEDGQLLSPLACKMP